MEQPLEQHVSELRKRFFRSLVAFLVAAGISFYYSPAMLEFLQRDLSLQLNALTAYEVFYTQILLASLSGLFLSLPVILYQALMFVKPGLRESEYRVLRNYLPFSVLLFMTGAAFGYQVIVKYSLRFFRDLNASADVAAVWGLKSTLGLAIKLSAFTGLVFQIPILSLVLAKAGMLTSGMMRGYRNYFVLLMLLLAAVSTPPDLFTQVLVTLPVIVLYQLSIWLVARTE